MEEIERLSEQISRVEKEQARMGEQIKGALKRIDEQKQLTESVHSLALSLERLTSAQKSTEAKVSALSNDVDELKEKPAKRWESAVGTLIAAVISAVAAYILAKAGM